MQCVASLIILLWVSSCKADDMAETLDIAKDLDGELFDMEPMTVDGSSYNRYTPKKGFVIAKVIQDYNFIWQRISYKQKCIQVDVYTSNDKPFLISMLVIKPDDESSLFFMNTISTWNSITYEEFISARNRDTGVLGFNFRKKKGSFLSLSIHLGLMISLLCSFYGLL